MVSSRKALGPVDRTAGAGPNATPFHHSLVKSVQHVTILPHVPVGQRNGPHGLTHKKKRRDALGRPVGASVHAFVTAARDRLLAQDNIAPAPIPFLKNVNLGKIRLDFGESYPYTGSVQR